MPLKSSALILALLPFSLLGGCASGPHSAGSVSLPGVGQPQSQAWIGRDKVGRAIILLQNGDAAAARKILIEVLVRQPSDTVAQSLVKQIDEDPQTLLGVENFKYVTRDGDSFSSIAQRFLGNPTLFYGLARYNRVLVPSSLGKGVELRIPGHAKREPGKPEVRAEPPAIQASAKPLPMPKAPPTSSTDPRRAAQLRAKGLEEMNRGTISRAVTLLTEASRLDPSNPLIKRDLDRAIRIRHTVQGR
jgi:hypothetical protein